MQKWIESGETMVIAKILILIYLCFSSWTVDLVILASDYTSFLKAKTMGEIPTALHFHIF